MPSSRQTYQSIQFQLIKSEHFIFCYRNFRFEKLGESVKKPFKLEKFILLKLFRRTPPKSNQNKHEVDFIFILT